MISVAKQAEIAVAVNMLAAFMPLWLKIEGFTAKMYAIDKNVTQPAKISVFTFVLCSFSLKNCAIFSTTPNLSNIFV